MTHQPTRIKPFVVDGMTMDKETILKKRQSMIELRDAALRNGMLDWAFEVSIVIAILHNLAEVVES